MCLMWQQLGAFFLKELQLLRRDRGGLIVLFVMPLALVIIVSLVQNNILKVSGARTVKLLLIDNDNGEFGQRLLEQLDESGSFRVTRRISDSSQSRARLEVGEGQWQVGVLLPEGLSQQLRLNAMDSVRQGFTSTPDTAAQPLTVEYFFDPAVQGGLRGGVSGMLQQLVARQVLTAQMDAFKKVLPAQIERQISSELGPMFSQVLSQHELQFNFPDPRQPLLQATQVRTQDGYGHDAILATSVQHNVPAWSLFGIFFIILPLSSVMLQERSYGIFPRILLMPGGRLGMLGGRLLAYLLVCMIQFSIVLAVGFFLLPHLGTDILQLNGKVVPLFIVAICAGLTACGFGLLLGVLARSEQQAIMIASVTIVIAAALGGIMVPVYMMPNSMQPLSVISPLGWGIEACQVLLLRGGVLRDILPQLSAMIICFCACVMIALRKLSHN